MLRQFFLATALGFASGPTFAETCTGPSDDGTETFTVVVTKGSDGKPSRLELQSDAEAGTTPFTAFTDLTPKAPTDERFRFVFHDGTPIPGELAVMVMEGGFTQSLTAQIWVLGAAGEEPTALGTLNCRR